VNYTGLCGRVLARTKAGSGACGRAADRVRRGAVSKLARTGAVSPAVKLPWHFVLCVAAGECARVSRIRRFLVHGSVDRRIVGDPYGVAESRLDWHGSTGA
jgi:hypothetical protein